MRTLLCLLYLHIVALRVRKCTKSQETHSSYYAAPVFSTRPGIESRARAQHCPGFRFAVARHLLRMRYVMHSKCDVVTKHARSNNNRLPKRVDYYLLRDNACGMHTALGGRMNARVRVRTHASALSGHNSGVSTTGSERPAHRHAAK